MNTLRNILKNKWFYAALAVAAALYWWLGGTPENKNAAAAVRVTAALVIKQDVPVQVPLVGTVVPYEMVAIKSRLDSQQVTDVLFHDGDEVKEGQVLFRLDDRAIVASIKQMEAALAKERAQLVNLKLQYERAQKLVQSHAVPQAQVDEAKAAYEAEIAQVGEAQANLDNARVQLTYATITAPITGRTGTISVTRGNNVKANDTQALVTINQVKPIRVQFSTPQRYYEQVRNALQRGEVTVVATHKDSSDTTEGKLEYLDNTIDVSNGTFAARAVFANGDEKLWPGMFVNVSLRLGVEKDALTIPAVAVQGDEGNHFVFKIDPQNKKAVRTPVDISQDGSSFVIVTKGLNEVDQVITDGILRVTDGGAVVEVTAPAATEKTAGNKS